MTEDLIKEENDGYNKDAMRIRSIGDAGSHHE